MSLQVLDRAAAPARSAPYEWRLGECVCVIDAGTDLRHGELPHLDELLAPALSDGCSDLVFDLTQVRRYETFALVRLARSWDALAAAGCTVHVAVRNPRVVADLRRLAVTGAWELHESRADALRALLSAPVG